MKLTKSKLSQLIKEEVYYALNEDSPAGPGGTEKGIARGASDDPTSRDFNQHPEVPGAHLCFPKGGSQKTCTANPNIYTPSSGKWAPLKFIDTPMNADPTCTKRTGPAYNWRWNGYFYTYETPQGTFCISNINGIKGSASGGGLTVCNSPGDENGLTEWAPGSEGSLRVQDTNIGVLLFWKKVG